MQIIEFESDRHTQDQTLHRARQMSLNTHKASRGLWPKCLQTGLQQ